MDTSAVVAGCHDGGEGVRGWQPALRKRGCLQQGHRAHFKGFVEAKRLRICTDGAQTERRLGKHGYIIARRQALVGGPHVGKVQKSREQLWTLCAVAASAAACCWRSVGAHAPVFPFRPASEPTLDSSMTVTAPALFGAYQNAKAGKHRFTVADWHPTAPGHTISHERPRPRAPQRRRVQGGRCPIAIAGTNETTGEHGPPKNGPSCTAKRVKIAQRHTQLRRWGGACPHRAQSTFLERRIIPANTQRCWW